jgi:hypothetical protein
MVEDTSSESETESGEESKDGTDDSHDDQVCRGWRQKVKAMRSGLRRR